MTEQQERAQLMEQIERKQLMDGILANQGQAQPRPAPTQPEERDLGVLAKDAGRNALNMATGVGSTALGVMDMGGQVKNFLTKAMMAKQLGVNPLKADLPEQLQQPTFTDVLPQTKVLGERIIPKGESAVSDALRTASEWGAGGLVNAGRKTASAIPDLYAAGGAAAGEYLGDKFSEGAGDISEMVGGILGAIKGDFSKATNVVDLAKKSAIDFMEGQSHKAVPKVAEEMSSIPDPAKWLMANNKAVGQAPSALESSVAEALRRGEKGTLADLSRDQGIANIEAAIPKGSTAATDIKQNILEREQQIIGEVSKPFGNANPAIAPEIAAQKVKSTKGLVQAAADAKKGKVSLGAEKAIVQSKLDEAMADQQAGLMRAKADQEASNIGTDLLPHEASRNLATSLKAKEAADKEVAKGFWETFDEGADIGIDQIQQNLKDYISSIDPVRGKDLTAKYKSILSNIDDWKGKAPPSSVQYVLSQLKDVTATAKQTGNYGSLEKAVSDISRTMDDYLRSPAGSPAFKDAIKATADQYKRTGAEKLGKVRLNPEDETLIKRMNFEGEAGAGSARLLKQSDDANVVKDSIEGLKALGVKEGVDESFLKKYDGFLAEFPALRKEFEATAMAQKSATATEKLADKAVKTQQGVRKEVKAGLDKAKSSITKQESSRKSKVDKSLINKYAEAPNTTVKDLLKNPDEVKKLTSLYARLTREGAGDAFKAQVKDELMRKVAPTVGDAKRISSKAITEFDGVKKSLVDSGILSKADAAEITKSLEKTSTGGLRKTAEAAKLDDKLSRVEGAIATGLSAGALKTIGGNSSLVIAGLVRREMKQMMLDKRGNPAIVEQLTKFMSDPEAYLEAAKGARTAKEAADSIITKIVAGSQAANQDKEQEQ